MIRAAGIAVALHLFMQWQSIGQPWIGLFMWLLCMTGAEIIVHVSRSVADRRRRGSAPLRGGRRRTDPS
jgi:hypothetical protein